MKRWLNFKQNQFKVWKRSQNDTFNCFIGNREVCLSKSPHQINVFYCQRTNSILPFNLRHLMRLLCASDLRIHKAFIYNPNCDSILMFVHVEWVEYTWVRIEQALDSRNGTQQIIISRMRDSTGKWKKTKSRKLQSFDIHATPSSLWFNRRNVFIFRFTNNRFFNRQE